MARLDASARQRKQHAQVNDPLKETRMLPRSTSLAQPVATPAKALEALGMQQLSVRQLHQLVQANNLHELARYVTTTFQRNVDNVSEKFVRTDYYCQWATPFNPAYHPELNKWKKNAFETLSCIPELKKHSEYQRLIKYMTDEMDYAQRTKAKYFSTLRSRLGIHATNAPTYDQDVLEKLSPEQMEELHKNCLKYLQELENPTYQTPNKGLFGWFQK